jgi:hypothetical protein
MDTVTEKCISEAVESSYLIADNEEDNLKNREEFVRKHIKDEQNYYDGTQQAFKEHLHCPGAEQHYNIPRGEPPWLTFQIPMFHDTKNETAGGDGKVLAADRTEFRFPIPASMYAAKLAEENFWEARMQEDIVKTLALLRAQVYIHT